LVFKQGRFKARKMALQQTPLAVISESVEETPDSLEVSSALVTVGQKRKKTNAKMGGVAQTALIKSEEVQDATNIMDSSLE
jgi:hypothetical protein